MNYNQIKNSGNVLTGIAAAPGITIAKAFLYSKDIESISSETINDVKESKSLLKEALEKSKKELTKVFDLAVDKLGEKRAAIFEAQVMILEDQVLIDTLMRRITDEKKSPEFIVNDEISKYQNLMSASNESYMKERSHDIEDIKNRIIRNLKNKKWKSRIKNDVIVVAKLITPADTVLFTRVNVKGYVTNLGGLTSHAAIVARSLNIPAIVGVHDANVRINDDDLLIIDGYHGLAIINPTDDQLRYYEEKIERLNKIGIELGKLRNLPASTLDNHEIKILANLDVNEEIEFIVQNGAKGIGLVRTEQLFQFLETFPDEETQFKSYLELAEKLYPEKITIRTFDIGGDKVLPMDVKEPNPMLGWRGIRFLLDHKELFKTQIRAILRSGIHGNVNFMIPMVSSVIEVVHSKELIELSKNELLKEGLNFDNEMQFGIMIEIPSASLLIREFADIVDFYSIGTNDLIQYLLAVDRGNDIVNSAFQEFHPAVIRALDFMVKEAKQANKPISICGEMASDSLAIPLILGLGFDSISVNAAAIPGIKKIIRSLNFREASILTGECLKLKTEHEIKTRIKSFYFEKYKEDILNIF